MLFSQMNGEIWIFLFIIKKISEKIEVESELKWFSIHAIVFSFFSLEKKIKKDFDWSK